jgi:uncharacterized protein YeaO (DUF488 family)
MVKLKRAYEPPARGDGYRVLVDRMWPRGLRKEDLVLDEWLKDVAPSAGLRKWFGHDPKRWPEFKRRYEQELEEDPASEGIRALSRRARRGTLTLLFASRDNDHNNAVVLGEILGRLAKRPQGTTRPKSHASNRR